MFTTFGYLSTATAAVYSNSSALALAALPSAESSSGQSSPVQSGTALFSTVPSSIAGPNTVLSNQDQTSTVHSTVYTTIDYPTPTAFEYGTSTYYITAATTLTLEQCDCTKKPVASPPGSRTTSESVPTGPVAAAGQSNSTVTSKSTKYVTIPCESTTLTYGLSTFTVSSLTTLTLEDCECTKTPSSVETKPTITSSAAPPVVPVPQPAPETSTTVQQTQYVTIPCPSSTTVTYNSKTYTVNKPTTLTLEHCGCTESALAPSVKSTSVAPSVESKQHSAPSLSASAVSSHHAPPVANDASLNSVGAAFGVIAAVACFL